MRLYTSLPRRRTHARNKDPTQRNLGVQSKFEIGGWRGGHKPLSTGLPLSSLVLYYSLGYPALKCASSPSIVLLFVQLFFKTETAHSPESGLPMEDSPQLAPEHHRAAAPAPV